MVKVSGHFALCNLWKRRGINVIYYYYYLLLADEVFQFGLVNRVVPDGQGEWSVADEAL